MRRRPRLAPPQMVDRPAGREPSQKRSPIADRSASAATNRFRKNVLAAIQCIFPMLQYPRNGAPYRWGMGPADKVPVDQVNHR